jgi:ubiquinone/menaquinone biosynthesis C-methylase UbiE
MDDHLRLEFNEWAKAGRGESMETGHKPVGAQAIEQMNIPPHARVLDLGCGSGWATRLMAAKAARGRVLGIDISDEMVRIAQGASASFSNIEFRVGSAEHLPFGDHEFTHAFSMESLYYYSDVLAALREIHRVLERDGLFVTVVDLYAENKPSHQWIDMLKVPVHLLSIADYRSLFEQAGFVNVIDARLYDPTPSQGNYSGTSFKTHDDYIQYRQMGSLMLRGEVDK